VRRAHETGTTIRETVLATHVMSEAEFDDLLTAEAVCRLGTPASVGRGNED
jgi:fumarate hydratase class II